MNFFYLFLVTNFYLVLVTLTLNHQKNYFTDINRLRSIKQTTTVDVSVNAPTLGNAILYVRKANVFCEYFAICKNIKVQVDHYQHVRNDIKHFFIVSFHTCLPRRFPNFGEFFLCVSFLYHQISYSCV